MSDNKRATFYAATKGSPHRLFHIETDGAIVNIEVGLTDEQGNAITRVEVVPDDENRGGDWHLLDNATTVVRLLRPVPAQQDPHYNELDELTSRRKEEATRRCAGDQVYAGPFDTWRLAEHATCLMDLGQVVFDRRDRVLVSPDVDSDGYTLAYSHRRGMVYATPARCVREIGQ